MEINMERTQGSTTNKETSHMELAHKCYDYIFEITIVTH
mgnify:FL=1